VRGELERWYDENKRAFLAKDYDAIMALRTPEYHTVTSERLVHEHAEMERFTRALLDGTERWGQMSFDIDSVSLSADRAEASVNSRITRVARDPNGQVYPVEIWDRRRDSWRKTPGGWKLYRSESLAEQMRVGVRYVLGQHPIPIP
jgi:hypothetical protein